MVDFCLYFIFLELWAALKWGSEHQSSDSCLSLVSTTAALVLFNLLLPHCVHCLWIIPFTTLLVNLPWPGLRPCGDVRISWWLERWGVHCSEDGICVRRMGCGHLGSGLGKWGCTLGGWAALLLDWVITFPGQIKIYRTHFCGKDVPLSSVYLPIISIPKKECFLQDIREQVSFFKGPTTKMRGQRKEHMKPGKTKDE